MAGSLDPSMGGNAADLIFKSRALRPYLDHPGFVHGSASTFVKPQFSVNPRAQTEKAHPSSYNTFLPFDPSTQDPGASPTRPRACVKVGGPRRSRASLPTGGAAHVAQRVGGGAGGAGGTAATTPALRDELGVAHSSASVGIYVEGDPALIDFSEEPEDPRVRVPAHRIGDSSAMLSHKNKMFRARQRERQQTFGGRRQMSAPTLLVSARRMPLAEPSWRG